MAARHPDAERWNSRYQAEAGAWLAREPRELLLENIGLLPETGVVLEAAAGVGASGLFLAKLGFRVFAMDISEIALALAVRRARKLGVKLEAVVVDLANIWLPSAYFDVILNFYFLQRPALSAYGRALKPGGLLFFETYLKGDGDFARSEHYLNPGELASKYQHWERLLWSQEVKPSRESGQLRKIERLIVRKPLPDVTYMQIPQGAGREL